MKSKYSESDFPNPKNILFILTTFLSAVFLFVLLTCLNPHPTIKSNFGLTTIIIILVSLLIAILVNIIQHLTKSKVHVFLKGLAVQQITIFLFFAWAMVQPDTSFGPHNSVDHKIYAALFMYPLAFAISLPSLLFSVLLYEILLRIGTYLDNKSSL